MSINDIKVLLISPLPPPVGGDSTWALKYLEYSDAHGNHTEIVNTSLIGKRALTAGDSVRIADEARRCWKIWKCIRKAISDFKPDVVHMNTNCSSRGLLRDYISSRIVHRKKIPLIIHCRCNVGDQIGDSKAGRFFFKKLSYLAAKVIVQNSPSLQYVRGATSTDAEIVANYIEDIYVIDSKTIRDYINTIVFIGHVRATKGVEELLKAAKKFPEIHFILAGPVTGDYSSEEVIRDSIGNVTLTGSIPANEVKMYLDSADLFLFPTYTEGFSNSLLEAMARGVPIITTNVGANHDMIENCGGIIVETRNVGSIIGAINDLKDKQRRQSMSEWNINKVAGSYTIDRIMAKLQSIYREVLNENHM